MTRLAAAPLERPLFKRGIPRLVLIEDEGQPFRRFNELRRTEGCQEGVWNAVVVRRALDEIVAQSGANLSGGLLRK